MSKPNLFSRNVRITILVALILVGTIVFLFIPKIPSDYNGFYYDTESQELIKINVYAEGDSINIVPSNYVSIDSKELSPSIGEYSKYIIKGKITSDTTFNYRFQSKYFQGTFKRAKDSINLELSQPLGVGLCYNVKLDYDHSLGRASTLLKQKRVDSFKAMKPKDLENLLLRKIAKWNENKSGKHRRIVAPLDYNNSDSTVKEFLSHVANNNLRLAKAIQSDYPIFFILEKEKVHFEGNTFADDNFSRQDIGAMYHYGNYNYDLDLFSLNIEFYDDENLKGWDLSLGSIDIGLLQRSNGQGWWIRGKEGVIPSFNDKPFERFLLNIVAPKSSVAELEKLVINKRPFLFLDGKKSIWINNVDDLSIIKDFLSSNRNIQ